MNQSKRFFYKGKFGSVILSLSLLLSGCSLDGAIGNTAPAAGTDMFSSTMTSVAKFILPGYKVFDRYAVPAAAISFLIGGSMLIFFNRSKSMTKLAIFTFMILFPILFIAVDLGVGAWLSNCLYR